MVLRWVMLLALAACGPIEYVSSVTRTADGAVERARAADAEKHALYWWTRAVLYLRQARIEAAASDFSAANRFGRLAAEAADRARAVALAKAEDGNKDSNDADRKDAGSKDAGSTGSNNAADGAPRNEGAK